MEHILDVKILDLALARKAQAEALEERKRLVHEFEMTDAFKNASFTAEKCVLAVDYLEMEIKQIALADAIAPEPHPHEAVKIKNFTVVEIPDLMAVKEWCLHNMTPALTVNVKQIEKAAQRNELPSGLAMVTTEARAQIATDLSKYL